MFWVYVPAVIILRGITYKVYIQDLVLGGLEAQQAHNTKQTSGESHNLYNVQTELALWYSEIVVWFYVGLD